MILSPLVLLLAVSSVPPDQATTFRETAISPDGRHLAWVQDLRNADGSESMNTELTVDGRRMTAAKGKAVCEEHAVAWSPDSTRIAFLSDCATPKQAQLYLAAPRGSPHKLTNLAGFISSPRWSPDGKTIAMLFTENARRAAGPLEPSLKDEGVVEAHIFEQRLTLVDAASGATRQITPADTYVYEYDWSPDSTRLAYTAAKGNGDNNWWVAELFTIPAAGGSPQQVLKPPAQMAVPRYTHDGQQILFIGGIMSDEGSTGGDIYTVDASGGEARDITPGRKSSPSSIAPLASGKILFTETVDGSSAIGLLNPANNETEILWRGDESLRAGDDVLSIASDGRTVATVRSSWSLPPEVWAGPIGEWTQRSRVNPDQKPSWGRVEKSHWSSDGYQVEGWLMFPAQYDAAKRYPMVVSVHGGPAAAAKPHWPGWFDMARLSAEGYFVLFPNPRGSYGDGEDFAKANVKDFGYGDLRDINAGVDQVLSSYPVDQNRVGIAGWSYGGFMTMWTVTQTTRYRAAVAGAGISNWQSYYGENLIDQWMIPYFGASVYDDPAMYARSSPITFIKQVRTPTLILVGDSDAECPAPQSYEFWHALQALGVKTQFVVYPNEGHRFHVPEHQRDVMKRAVDWFNDNMK